MLFFTSKFTPIVLRVASKFMAVNLDLRGLLILCYENKKKKSQNQSNLKKFSFKKNLIDFEISFSSLKNLTSIVNKIHFHSIILFINLIGLKNSLPFTQEEKEISKSIKSKKIFIQENKNSKLDIYVEIKSLDKKNSNFYLNRQKLAQTEQLDLLNNLNNVFRLVVSEPKS
ncbi:hypothetical protein BpHYR1_026044 [Brachionus plicatilis]|uniref:Uncharacterized protein n=1 Tax=Brachionus plicatilis TaxID=10195 RepID=A0A3M7T0A0_BRAPC|nr:hypothetical protein BpHYR1_026044 [Brachionus plicatilis]